MQVKNPKFEISAVGPKQYPSGNLPLGYSFFVQSNRDNFKLININNTSVYRNKFQIQF